MKVAIVTAGFPRFTQDFIRVLNQLKGFDTADLYINLWSSSWAEDEIQAAAKVNKILPKHIVLKKLRISEQPERTLPPHDESLSNIDELKWWYDRRIGQIHCLKLAVDLIDEPYDVVVRVRPDGSLYGDLDISSLDLVNHEVIFCSTGMGIAQSEPNDQFFVGTLAGIKFLCDLYLDFDKYMLESCPGWTSDVHTWALEYIIGTYFKLNQKEIYRGSFDHTINRVGRSAYTTDKHSHVHIAEDPTA